MGYREIDVCDECGLERDRFHSGYSVGSWIRLDTGNGFPNHAISKGYDFCAYDCLVAFLNNIANEESK